MKGLAVELENDPVAVVGVTPGWLRSERMLENFGVSEANWRDACRDRPASRSPSRRRMSPDGSRPDCWGYIAAYGWEQEKGRGIEEFR